MRPAGDALVVMEVQLRHATQLHFLGQLHAQETCRRVQHLDALGNLFGVFLAHHGDEDLRVADVAADFHGGDGHQADAWILDFTTDQLRQFALHLITDTLGTAVFFCHVLLPVTASR
ncbi:hypothetical protein BME99_04565 [Pseudomonas protegens]|nr:hypothetical protein BME99_04565 [Pseudomonas protegens]